MKKVLALAAVLCLIISSLVGCSKDEKTSSTEDVKDFGGRTFKVGMDTMPKEGTDAYTAFQTRMEEIKEKYHCDIEFMPVTSDTYDTIYSSILSGSPIVDLAPLGEMGQFYSNAKINMYYPLNDLDAIDLKDSKWNSSVVSQFTYDGKNYALAKYEPTLGQMVFFNKDLLKRSGITEDIYDLQKNGTWTLDKMLEIAKKVTKKSSDGKNDVWGIVEDEYSFLRHLIVANGVDFIKETDGTYTFGLDDPKALDAMTTYQKLYTVDKILLPQQEMSDRSYGKNIFAEGKAAFIISYPRFTDVLELMSDEFGAVLFPKVSDEGQYTSILDWYFAYFIPKTVKDPQTVGAFANVFFEPYNDDYRGDNLISQFKLQNSKSYRDSRVLNETFELVFNGGLSPQKYFMFFNGVDVWDDTNGIYTIYRDLSLGVKTPAAAVEALMPRANSIIAEKLSK